MCVYKAAKSETFSKLHSNQIVVTGRARQTPECVLSAAPYLPNTTVLAFCIELRHLPDRLELQWFQVRTFIIIANDYEIWVFKN